MIARKEAELIAKEKLLEDKSNTLLQLQNELLKEKRMIEEKKFDKFVNKLKVEDESPKDDIKLKGNQIYQMIVQASEMIDRANYKEARRLYNTIYHSFTGSRWSKDEKLGLELSINNLYNDLNLAILNQ